MAALRPQHASRNMLHATPENRSLAVLVEAGTNLVSEQRSTSSSKIAFGQSWSISYFR